jgi:pimeloyl-ACP methyl ester carboxylesterase
MTKPPEQKDRNAQYVLGKNGRTASDWNLTDSSLTDFVKLEVPPNQVVPIIFVPGIMGSNLCEIANGEPVWLLDGEEVPTKLAMMWATELAGERQKILHPVRTRVYQQGAVPLFPVGTMRTAKDFRSRGWGEVAQTSYHAFLIWLENKMNSEGFNPLRWDDFSANSVQSATEKADPWAKPKLRPGVSMRMAGIPSVAEPGFPVEPVLSDELLHRARCRFPVYAFGYNWLASNKLAAAALQKRIDEVIAANNGRQSSCNQVILVTHSMGGLVARACCQLAGMQEKIVGVVHGVMPAVGAAVAYRRCKVGMRDEDLKAALVIGLTGTGVTAVFAQAPGALQLLPSKDYGMGWLTIKSEEGKQITALPVSDPYEEIYLNKKNWWGLVREEWLSPRNGAPITWNEFAKNIQLAKDFHEKLAGAYHPSTYVFYGIGKGGASTFNSFSKVQWKMSKGMQPKGKVFSPIETSSLTHREVRSDGSNLLYVGGSTEILTTAFAGSAGVSTVERSFWELRAERHDAYGDGTVPESSGAAPRRQTPSKIAQQFKLAGFDHESAYKDTTARQVTYYAITKLARKALIE